MQPIKVGLAGYGFSGQSFHRPLLSHLEEFHIEAVLSSNEEKVLKDIEGATVVSTLDDLLKKDIELVVITTPNHLHYSMIKKSLLSGKHVIVEKPFVTNSKDGEELLALAKEKGLHLSVFHNRRWDADFLTIQQLLKEESLGPIYTYEAHFDRFRPAIKDRWKENKIEGAGVLYDLGSHLLDQALTLFGKPKWVQADVFPQRNPEKAEDYFLIILGYDVMRVQLYSRSIVLDPGPRYQVHGLKGSFVKHGMDRQEDDLKAGKNPVSEEWGMEGEENWGLLTTISGEEVTSEVIPSEKGDYTQFYLGVYGAVRENAPLPVDPQDALDVITLIEACKKSAESRRVINID
ncbi:scyllo-inositol 2-dehydrogenase (NADP+) [Bacillus sp. V-88]|nr:oxidoreductase [Bacillus sp. DSM 27956]PRX77034.1 scyllo-inositol 2-dehydrogenase (NADP+) [Bacillus sp. V-88]SLK21125.1 scyllo-inositol 2-dehydrogenase (NADP+) [Bacillus sp. V-88]